MSINLRKQILNCPLVGLLLTVGPTANIKQVRHGC